jgi:hypothetical protein
MVVGVSRRALLAAGCSGALLALAGCESTFSTSYAAPVQAGVAQTWRVVDVRVTVPTTLTVSEAKTYLPAADIVWREDPPGDRRAQVGRIVGDAARAAAAPLRGGRPVVLDITLRRFHALTFEAETQLTGMGVHNIDFILAARDARTGELLAGPEDVKAALPAYAGVQMTELRLKGQTQKSQITAHLRQVFAGWLGIGPDVRDTFTRIGG